MEPQNEGLVQMIFLFHFGLFFHLPAVDILGEYFINTKSVMMKAGRSEFEPRQKKLVVEGIYMGLYYPVI